MKRRRLTIAALALALGGAAAAQTLTEQQAASGKFKIEDQGAAITPAAATHFAAARAAAGTQFLGPLLLCNQGRPAALKWQLPTLRELRLGALPEGATIEPTRIFDNLYYFGTDHVSAYAVATRDGIIVIDSLDNKGEAASIIAAGLRKYGLDPATIKYVVVTHGHGDHYGGAAYLAQTYHARVLMSDKDWALAPTTLDKPYFDPAPPRDLVIADGQKLSLGGETITMIMTPGHTPGTVSLLIPVTDHGQRHLVALWGGTGFNFPHSPPRFKVYADSADRFRRLAKAAGADVVLSNHPENDGVVGKSVQVAHRGAGDPNPFVVGADGVRRFLTALEQCALAYGAQVQG